MTLQARSDERHSAWAPGGRPDRRRGLRTVDAATDSHHVFGVRIANVSRAEGVALVERAIEDSVETRAFYIANAHTLNLASADPAYRDVLNSGHRVFADGTGLRWASALRGAPLKSNMVGTDFIPDLFEATSGRGMRYFLMGSTPKTVAAAARTCTGLFPGWELAGYHHGYLGPDTTPGAIETINDAAPHVVLVAMGNPLQETWIHDHLDDLRVPVCIGVGGLFDHWAGNLTRAPWLMRKLGCEWAQIMLQQPHKWRRYVLGNPAFLYRMVRDLRSDIEQTRKHAPA